MSLLKFLPSLAFLALFGCLLVTVEAAPLTGAEQGVTTLDRNQIAGFKPYTYYAKAAYCSTANTKTWNCGANCQANPKFLPVASGGDTPFTHSWYVGYDPTLKTVIVSYQSTQLRNLLAATTDWILFLGPLDPEIFPNLGNEGLKAHTGFAIAHKRSALDVLAAVRTALAENSANKVTIVGHSVGGALAHFASIHLPLNLPGVEFRMVTYGSPRVGNQAFVNYINTHGTTVDRINNRHDPIPGIILDGTLGYKHVNGEIHIADSLEWMSCPGPDNNHPDCTKSYIPGLLGVVGLFDHFGPYDGISMPQDLQLEFC